MKKLTFAVTALCLFAVACSAQEVDRTIDRYETKFLEKITEYNAHDRAINDNSIFFVPLLGEEPRPMGRDDLVNYLVKLRLYRDVDIRTITSEALKFNNAYKDQMRYEFMPMILAELNQDLNEFANYIENSGTPLSDADYQRLLRMNMVLEEFSRRDSVRSNPFIKPALDRVLHRLDNLGGGGRTQPNVDTRYIDKIEGNWELSLENKPTMVVKVFLDGQKGSYCGRILTQPNLRHYNQGDVIWRDIHFHRVYDDDWEVERYRVYEFKGIERHYISGQWREDELLLTLYCETYDSDGSPEGCATMGWNSVTHGYSLRRPLR